MVTTDGAFMDLPSHSQRLLVRVRDREAWIIPHQTDPRWMFACANATYVVLGHLLLSFNRSPEQILVAIDACAAMDVIYTYVSVRMFIVPLSGVITGLGLSILFTAPGNTWLMLLAAWIAITSKYAITWRGRHLYNPANAAMVALLLGAGGRVAVAPAYQWGGYWQVLPLVFAFGLTVTWRVGRLPLVLSFWAAYSIGAIVRAQITQLPATITLYTQLSSGAFWLFTFSMITDPKTSPVTRRGMVAFGVAIAFVDMWLQLRLAVFSLFYALFLVSTLRALWLIAQDLRQPSTPGSPS